MKQRNSGTTTFRLAAILAAAILLSAIGPPPGRAMVGAPPAASHEHLSFCPITEHVVVISIDGLRPDAIEKFGAVTILRLMRQGSYSLRAETVLPSKTLPAHTSMLTGVDPSLHGVTWNDGSSMLSQLLEDDARKLAVPTVFTLVKQASLESAAFFSKLKLRTQLETPRALDHVEAPPRWLPRWLRWDWSPEHVADRVEEYLIEDGQRPNLLFIHLDEPDDAGHANGWMSSVYGRAVLEADQAVAEILAVVDRAFGRRNYTLIVTADHGGVDYDHGGDHLQEILIPWITWGKGVRPGTEIMMPVRITDTAPTILWLLGVHTPEVWSSQPVKAAYAGCGRFGGSADMILAFDRL